MRLSTIFFSFAALFVAVNATPGFSTNKRGRARLSPRLLRGPARLRLPNSISAPAYAMAVAPLNLRRGTIDTMPKKREEQENMS
ncbi:hypothetical protein R3P38DRAFT_756062 [Favolaschia claudopus]|uniref:Uncharacterized protein n=1 Tax=Favolaschia claudopus TaxID=2862362 RepID=A0AAV9Z3N0_9AGAR